MFTTVFYSWQSDLPNKTNRGFIEECLKKAIRQLMLELEIDYSPRPELKIDKDTKDVPGSPPIVDTIFKKIDESLAFVADVSFVGMQKDGKRLMPNTNVMIEYGYAIRAKGNERIIKVMNTTFGGPMSIEGIDQLPFDMRHVRWPICYELTEDAAPETRKETGAKLVKDLKGAIALILDQISSQQINSEIISETNFEEIKPGYAISTYLAEGEKLISQIEDFGGGHETYFLDPPPHAFLRLIPIMSEIRYRATELGKLATDRATLPFMVIGHRPSGGNWGTNKYGFVIHNGGMSGESVTNAVQLFENGEIWAINANFLFKSASYAIIPFFENKFVRALNSYRDFLEHKLRCPYPYKFIIGMVGVEGCRLSMPEPPGNRYYSEKIQGLCVKEEIIETGSIDATTTTEHALIPFFEAVWDACDRQRPRWLYRESED